MPESPFYGYDFRSSQPCERLRGKLKLGSLRDTKHIDEWLLDYFAVETDRIADARARAGEGQDALVRAVVERTLVLYGELVRACGFPSFDDGRVLRVETVDNEPDSYLATVALPVIDNLPLSVFRGLFRDALQLIQTGLAQEPSREAADALYAELQESIIARFADVKLFGTSTMPVCEFAFRQKMPFRHMGNGVMRLGWGANSQLLHLSSVERDSSIGASIANDKHMTARVLRAAGLPAPDHFLVKSHDEAIEAAAQLGWPVVVKPTDLERSEGVTVDVTTEARLIEAYDGARAKSRNILVERQVPGVCHRIMVAKGQIVYVVKRNPKRVVGNGRNTVAELIATNNAKQAKLPPWKRVLPGPQADELAERCLAEVGLTLQSVPAEGQWAPLRPQATEEWGGVVDDLAGEIHPENAQLAIDAARALGLTVTGVDLMTVDISRPWHENGAIINEMNFRPQFRTFGREIRTESLAQALVEGDGRIPVHLVTGEGDLLRMAQDLKRQLSTEGRQCHLTSASHTEDAAGREMVMRFSTLFERSLALTMRPDVHELILVGEAMELFRRGLAVDRLESAYVVDDPERGERLVSQIRARFPVRSCRRVGR